MQALSIVFQQCQRAVKVLERIHFVMVPRSLETEKWTHNDADDAGPEASFIGIVGGQSLHYPKP